LPHLKTTYEQFRSDPGVAFLLVSIDDDTQRLQRYLTEMKFPFQVARASKDEMQRAMGFNDLPSTFYVDRAGIVRYQVLGFESHGDSDARVSWYIAQLKGQ
jgi:AhpC/TSA family